MVKPPPNRTAARLLLPGAWVGVALLAACETAPDQRSQWPPPDFHLDIRYAVVTGGQRQTHKRVTISADGLVVYREADDSLRSTDGAVVLPVYRRLCAYRMKWHSIRHLSRELHAAPVKELPRAPTPPPPKEVTHVVEFHLTYMANTIDFVAQDQVVGLMNRVLRIVNAFLPSEHGIEIPGMAGEPMEHHLQDVPEVTDSVAGALQFHRERLTEHATNPDLLRATFSLACVARDWELSELCITRLAAARPEEVAPLRDILARSRAAASQIDGQTPAKTP